MNLQEIINPLRDECDRLDQAIADLQGSAPRRGRPLKFSVRGKGRVMSAGVRKRILVAMKTRCATRRKRASLAKPRKA